MNERAAPIRAYRGVVFVLAAGYAVYQLGFGDWTGFGGPLRYLTIWALLASLLGSGWLLSYSLGHTSRRAETVAMAAAVFNVMVVYLYWKIFFTDPALIRSGPIRWHQEYYLHAVGPALQLFDALVLHRAFRRIWRAAVVLALMVPAYVVWIEVFVRRFNDRPAGPEASGLPYPFLNAMDGGERAWFYGLYFAVALAILAALALLMRGLGMVWPRVERPADRQPVRS